MKALIFTILLMSGIRSQAQLSTNQYRQVTSMIATATKPLIADISALKIQVKSLQDSLTAFKNGMVKSNQLVGYGDIRLRDSTATIKIIEYIKQ